MDNKVVCKLCPCPWCKKLPDLIFYFVEGTWLPKIMCRNGLCGVNPESKYQVIRKTCKTDLIRLKQKMDALFYSWNNGNPIDAKEGKLIDFDIIIAEGKKSEKIRKKDK